MAAEPQWELLAVGTHVHHVHPNRYTALAFNPHVDPKSLARFSPIFDATGSAIPSWYGGLSERGALYETIFRDVVGRADRTIYKEKLTPQVLSEVRLSNSVRLLKLFGTGPTTVGIHNQITKLLPNQYGISRDEAQRLHDLFPEAQGFIWRSRISDDELSFVVYADRVVPAFFGSLVNSVPLLSDAGLELVLEAANSLKTVIA